MTKIFKGIGLMVKISFNEGCLNTDFGIEIKTSVMLIQMMQRYSLSKPSSSGNNEQLLQRSSNAHQT